MVVVPASEFFHAQIALQHVMKILHVTPAFFPATYWGGPISSQYGLCNALAQLPDVELRVLTTDTAGPHISQHLDVPTYPVRYPAGYDVWITRRRFAASLAPRLFAELPNLIRWADLVHLTAVYSSPTLPTLALCRAIKRPIVWSPRGSLQRWSGTSNRSLKGIWELVARRLLDPDRTAMHCTSEEEAAASGRRMEGINVFVIPNGIDVSPLPRRAKRDEAAPLRVLYLGRIDPIKALDRLIAAVALAPQGSLQLTIAGMGAPELIEQLRRSSYKLDVENQVSFVGHVEGEAKEALFQEHDVLALVSHRENFGMVIVEALSRGVPIIASQGTPWQAAEIKGCGLWVENDPESLVQAMTRLRFADLEAMGAAGRAWMTADFSWHAIAGQMLGMYQELSAHVHSPQSR